MSDPIGYNGSYIDEHAFNRGRYCPHAQRDLASGEDCLQCFFDKNKGVRARTAKGESLDDISKRLGVKLPVEGLGPTPLTQGGKDFIVKDSGARQEFASGMVRDTAEGKTDYTAVLDGPMFDRWAEHLTKAKAKYPDIAPGVANWTLAEGEEEMARFRKSAFRHFRQWLRGDTDEDHAAAVLFNINGYEYVRAKLGLRSKQAA